MKLERKEDCVATPDSDPTRFLRSHFGNWQEVGQGAHAVSGDASLRMTATLGSCVAIILHDAVLKQGGMTHIYQCVDSGPLGGAAVVAEIETLVNALMHHGSLRSGFTARVVGGARTLGRGKDVGGLIAEVCLGYLEAERVPLTSVDLGGERPRRIQFEPRSGNLNVSYPGTPMPTTGTVPCKTGTTELF